MHLGNWPNFVCKGRHT